MESFLTQIGLTDKEAKVYLFLLAEGAQNAAHIAKDTNESRTNTYMILERLENADLVSADNASAVRRFTASDPLNLQKRLMTQQQQIRQHNAALHAALPELSSLFSLGQHKPGVVYLEGVKGFKALLEDNARTEGPIDLIASDEAMDDLEAWEMLQKGAVKRAARGINTRGLFHVTDDIHWKRIKKWENKGYTVKRWGKEALPGEIVIYRNKVAFTIYKPSLVVTIMTNEVMARTFRVIFEQLWQQAKS